MPKAVETRIDFDGWFPELYHGSCNGCNRYAGVRGMVPHRVASIHVGGMEFRLCIHCLSAMLAVLKQAKEAMDK